MNRYARQAAVHGWDQERLDRATVAVAGSGYAAFLTGLMAVAMGFGRLVLVGRDCHLSGRLGSLADLVEAGPGTWARLYERLNPEVDLHVSPPAGEARARGRLPDLDGYIAAGNGVRPLMLAEALARRGKVPAIAGSAAAGVGTWGVPVRDRLARRMARHPEDRLVAQMVAGLLVDEMRKLLMPLAWEAGPTEGRQVFSLPRLCPADEGRRPRSLKLTGPSVAVVGAGALGTWFGMGLGLSGRRAAVHLFDGDTVEETNLNRQVLFYGAVGEPKATTLAARLARLFPTLQMNGYGLLVEDDTAQLVADKGVVAACPDSFEVRAFLNRLCCRRGRVLVNGGTTAAGGSCSVYAPGHTPCLECLLGIERLARNEVEARGCGAADPSVVTSNAVTGAVMAWAVVEMLDERVPRGVWEFDGRPRDQRLGVHSQRPACRCHVR